MNGSDAMDARFGKFSGEGIDQREVRLIDLRQVAGIVRRRQWWIAGVVLAVLTLTAVAYLLVPRKYDAQAIIALDRKADEIVVGQSANNTLPTDSPTVDTAVQVLTSPALAGRVVERLRLDRVVGFGQTPDGVAVTPAQALARATGVVRSELAVKRSGLSYAIQLDFVDADPKMAATVVNAVAEQYVYDQLNAKSGARNRDTGLLRERLGTLRAEVNRAETAEAMYRANTNLIDVSKDSTSVQQEISVLNTQLANAQADEAAAVARLNAARTGESASSDNGSALIRSLRTQQADLSAKRADLAGRYGPLHPDLANVDRQLADVNHSIADETKRTMASLISDARVASGRTAAVRGSLVRAQGGLAAGNRNSVQLNELERNAESARGLYQAFLDRYKQSLAGEGTDQSNATIVSRATVPGGPSFPNRIVFALAGIVASLLAAAGVVLLLELLEAGFQNRQQVETMLRMPVLATVPDLASVPGVRLARGDPMAPANHLVEKRGSLFSEAFRSIRTSLRLDRSDRVARILAVASALPGEGKTTVSICLARSVALTGTRVVVVDCDVRRRTFSRSMTSDATVGLSEVLAGSATLDQALVRDEASGAWILPQSRGGAIDYELMASHMMGELVHKLADRFDLVILDTAPVLALAEARTIAGIADGVLFTTRWRHTPVRAAQLAIDLLERNGAKIYGSVLTLVNVKHQSRAGYGDEITYYKRFKGYYAEA